MYEFLQFSSASKLYVDNLFYHKSIFSLQVHSVLSLTERYLVYFWIQLDEICKSLSVQEAVLNAPIILQVNCVCIKIDLTKDLHSNITYFQFLTQ